MARGLGWLALPVALGLGALVALLPPDSALSLTFGIFGMLVLTILPYRLVLGLWAGSLAIWAIGPLSPVHMDAFRVGCAALLVLRGAPVAAERRHALASWVVPLVLVGSLVWVSGESILGAAIVIPGLLVGLLLTRTDDTQTILSGYALGVGLSSLVLLLTALGLEGLSPNDDPGIDRLTGLANNAPRLSMQCAAAIVIILGLGRIRQRAIRPLLLTVCSLALVASGGRVGILCLLIATLVAIYQGWLTFSRSLAAVAGGLLVLWVAILAGLGTATIDRFAEPSQAAGVDFSSGRIAVIVPALQGILDNPLAPYGADNFFARYGISPHSPMLAFGVAGGLAASLIVTVMFVRMCVLVARRNTSASGACRAAVLVVAVLAGYALVEPDGPFVGIEMLTLLLVSVVAGNAGASVDAPSHARTEDRGHKAPDRPLQINDVRASRPQLGRLVDEHAPDATSP